MAWWTRAVPGVRRHEGVSVSGARFKRGDPGDWATEAAFDELTNRWLARREMARRIINSKYLGQSYEPAVIASLDYERVVGKRGWLAMYEAMMAEALAATPLDKGQVA